MHSSRTKRQEESGEVWLWCTGFRFFTTQLKRTYGIICSRFNQRSFEEACVKFNVKIENYILIYGVLRPNAFRNWVPEVLVHRYACGTVFLFCQYSHKIGFLFHKSMLLQMETGIVGYPSQTKEFLGVLLCENHAMYLNE